MALQITEAPTSGGEPDRQEPDRLEPDRLEPDRQEFKPDLERIEIELLLEGIFRHYGFDFRAYAYASIRRRLWKRIEEEGLASISALQERVLHEPDEVVILGMRDAHAGHSLRQGRRLLKILHQCFLYRLVFRVLAFERRRTPAPRCAGRTW